MTTKLVKTEKKKTRTAVTTLDTKVKLTGTDNASTHVKKRKNCFQQLRVGV